MKNLHTRVNYLKGHATRDLEDFVQCRVDETACPCAGGRTWQKLHNIPQAGMLTWVKFPGVLLFPVSLHVLAAVSGALHACYYLDCTTFGVTTQTNVQCV
jgi:hypothetical protein